MKYAKLWGYSHDSKAFLLKLSDQTPRMRAVIHLKAESGPTATATVDIGPGLDLKIPLRAKEAEWISAEIRIGSQVVDKFGCTTGRVMCPHCLARLDSEPTPTSQWTRATPPIWRIERSRDTEWPLIVTNKADAPQVDPHREFRMRHMDDAAWLVWFLNEAQMPPM